jgi:hypothetical protein
VDIARPSPPPPPPLADPKPPPSDPLLQAATAITADPAETSVAAKASFFRRFTAAAENVLDHRRPSLSAASASITQIRGNAHGVGKLT